MPRVNIPEKPAKCPFCGSIDYRVGFNSQKATCNQCGKDITRYVVEPRKTPASKATDQPCPHCEGTGLKLRMKM